MLDTLWDESPSSRSIVNWMNDPDVQPDGAFLRNFSDVLNVRIVHYVDRLIGPLAKRIEEGIEGAKALDLHNVVRSFTFLANLIRPANASGGGGTNVLNYVDNRSVTPARDPMMLFGPKEPESNVIEAETAS